MTKSIPKKTTKPRSGASKPTLNSLQKSLTSLETRMKRADTLTRKSVKALETVIEALDARSKKDSTLHKAALTRKVNQLSAKLTDMVAQTQSSVNADLKSALENPNQETVEKVIARAEARLSASEAAQASAIAKINRHLANLAIAIDARFNSEEETRQIAVAALQAETQKTGTELTERIEAIETDSAAAFGQIGDKMAQITDELSRNNEAGSISIREKVSEIALQTQTEFEQYRANLDRRIENLEGSIDGNNAADTQRLERMMNGLSSRIEELEYGLANLPDQMAEAIPQSYVGEAQALQQQPAPYTVHGAQAQIIDAFTPAPGAAITPPETPPNPYLAEVPKTEDPARDSHIPLEFIPTTMSPPQTALPPSSEPVQVQAPPHAEHFDQAPPPPANIQTPPAETSAPAAPDLPYADPAYAETNPTMDKARIGGEKRSVRNLPQLTGRNLRVAALATSVAVVGFIGFKVLTAGGSDIPPNRTIATNAAGSETSAPVMIPAPAATTDIAPIGDYADNRAENIPIQGEAAKTLSSAAAAGDKVAQFQLGLSYMEQGRMDEGVGLIRKSANQNQPAAQYRLAKLYETGEGVAQDSTMARQLTERAARNGNRIAMHDLALYYAEGRGGVETNLQSAAKWFEKAAERGVVDSQFNLGVLFESGQGLPKNVTDAFIWYSIAATQGDQFAKTRVDVLSSTLAETDLAAAQARISKFAPVKIDEAANGIFRNVPWAKPADKNAQQVSQVRRAQQLLTEIGFDIGGADGAIGPKTRAAIIDFERSNSLPETGRVNTDLIDRLELAAGA